ncbi:MAG: hypothetical protein SCK28_06675 [Bacillota bacterium]|nr:hypothetical protein [Bacillota bacterium]
MAIYSYSKFGAAAGAYLGGIVFDYNNSYQLAFLLGALMLFISAANSYYIDESKGRESTIPLMVERGIS